MLRITVKVNMQRFLDKVDATREQIPFATALALTKTAVAVKDELRAGMSAAFQEVVTYTLNSMYVQGAKKNNLVATVGLKGADQGKGAIKWLRPEVYGGERQRGLEALLQSVNLPPSGMYAVPGKAAKMTSSNRIDISWVRSLVSDMAAQGVSGNVTKSNVRKRKNAPKTTYFVLLTKFGRLLPGIYGKRARHVLPFIIFVKQPRYAAKFDFYGIAERVANERFPVEFDLAVKRAMATAR